MSSIFESLEQADLAARRAHAARIAAVGDLLETFPQPSLIGMISARCQVSAQTARGWVREAAELRERPDLAAASARGELSQDQVVALRVLAEPGADGAWVETLASPLGALDFQINELQRLARREVARRLERTDQGRYLHMTPTRDERFVRGRFQLHPEEAAALEAELDRRVPDNTKWSDDPAAHADALMSLVADASGRGPGGRGGGRVKATVIVRSETAVLDGSSDQPGELPNGNLVPADVVRALAADGKVLRLDLSNVDLDAAEIPAVVRRWIWYRDHGRCRGVECATPTSGLQIHHIAPRRSGGNHHPSNGLLLCWRCHHVKVHRLGWRIVGDAEGPATWLRPDGTPYTPPPIVRRARSPGTGLPRAGPQASPPWDE